MLPVMDRVFGTFYLPRAWPAVYGIDQPMPESVTGQLLDPFAPRAPAIRPPLTIARRETVLSIVLILLSVGKLVCREYATIFP